MDKTILYIKMSKDTNNKKESVEPPKKQKRDMFSKLRAALPFAKKDILQIELTHYPLVYEELEVIRAEVKKEDSQSPDIFWDILKKQLARMLQREEEKEWNELPIWLSPQLAEIYNQYPNHYPEQFLRYLYHKLPFSDTIYIKDEMREECFSFVETIYPNCNKMIIWVIKEERMEDWEKITDMIYQTTGLLVELVEELPEAIALTKDKWRNSYQPLFFDFSDREDTAYRKIPKNTIYVDMLPTKQKRRILTGKRSDLTYLTYANFLDMNTVNTV